MAFADVPDARLDHDTTKERDNMNRLQDKVAIVTGGGNGIGRASAKLFASEGARVVVAEFQADAGARTAEEIRASGGQAIFVHTDVTDEASVRNMVAETDKAYGSLDVLYNNAGASFSDDGSFLDAAEEVFWRSIRLNAFGPWLCARHAVPLIERGGKGGSVINTTSVAALVGLHRIDAYTAAKGAIAALTRSMAVGLAPKKIRVNAIAPTSTLTERVVAMNAKRDTGAQGSRNLLGSAEPVEMGYMALYLASDESRITTGQIMRIDSGLTIS
jgi:NAD(P)-dependent dehydrogenase (short-subunit alcohol dehydrogenase family)